jgi:putative ABC transport system ATP-binding protein
MMPVLKTSNLHKTYSMGEHSVSALDGVDFIVEKGEFVAIMGPSGSGKSTLLHLIGGLDQPSSGEVVLAGKPLSLLTDKQTTLLRRRNVGFVFQFFNLLPTLSTEENILLPILIDGKDLRLYQERLSILLELIGLADRRLHKPDQLSGGEQQRVALARALVTEPAILLADEPTGNLDSRTGLVIMGLLRRTCDDLGQTTVIVTHDPRAAAYADRVVFIKDGKIVDEIHLGTANLMSSNIRRILEEMERLEKSGSSSEAAHLSSIQDS